MRIILVHREQQFRKSMSEEVYHALKVLGYTVIKKRLNDFSENMLEKNDWVVQLLEAEDKVYFTKMLEKKGIPYSGNRSAVLEVGNDKMRVKQHLMSQGIGTPPGIILSPDDRDYEVSLRSYTFPLILKAVDEHASLYLLRTSVVYDQRQLKRELHSYFTVKKQVLAESFIRGREFCVPVVGTKSPFALPVCSVFFARDFFDSERFLFYEIKHDRKEKLRYYCRSFPFFPLEDKLKTNLQQLAVRTYQSLGCEGYATVDMRVNEQGEIFVLDVNPNCDIGYYSDISFAALEAGIPYPELINLIFFDKPIQNFFDKPNMPCQE